MRSSRLNIAAIAAMAGIASAGGASAAQGMASGAREHSAIAGAGRPARPSHHLQTPPAVPLEREVDSRRAFPA